MINDAMLTEDKKGRKWLLSPLFALILFWPGRNSVLNIIAAVSKHRIWSQLNCYYYE
jgi:hypothetical protein